MCIRGAKFTPCCRLAVTFAMSHFTTSGTEIDFLPFLLLVVVDTTHFGSSPLNTFKRSLGEMCEISCVLF